MTVHLRLQRIEQTDFATYGHLLDDENKVWCATLERPWLDNAHDESCIEPGSYTAHRRLSPKRGYDVFELDQVPGRGNIEIHRGNLPQDSEGCILLGTAFGAVNGQPGIVESRIAFDDFMNRLHAVNGITLDVLPPSPDPAP